jgi:D-proline reductase (dithiol) PrdB
MAWYHQYTAKLLGQFPWIYERLTLLFAGDLPAGVTESPWTPLSVNPVEARLMLITTGGVHRPDQTPFDMSDSRGDTSFRWIPRNQKSFDITHDYYDHSDADEDINCLYPLPLARRLSNQDLIGRLVERHPSFMGHIEDPIVPELMTESLPKLWEELEDRPDLILLSPG